MIYISSRTIIIMWPVVSHFLFSYKNYNGWVDVKNNHQRWVKQTGKESMTRARCQPSKFRLNIIAQSSPCGSLQAPPKLDPFGELFSVLVRFHLGQLMELQWRLHLDWTLEEVEDNQTNPALGVVRYAGGCSHICVDPKLADPYNILGVMYSQLGDL